MESPAAPPLTTRGRRLSARQAASLGFTLIELMTVTVVMGTLAGMAKGDVPYDAAAAQAAADNMLALANINMMAMWPAGSDSASITGTNALAAIWAEGSTIGEKAGAHTEAAKAMQAAAGVDLASLQGGMEALGGSCGGCHKEFKASQ